MVNVMEEDFETDTKEYEKIVNSYKYKEVKKSLRAQLKNNNIAEEVFKDLVEDYMRLYITKELLAKNIKDTGVSIAYRNRNGYTTPKTNPSVSDFNKVNLQMIKLLDKLKLEPILKEDDEDEL